nr:hypothetical protein [uncultured Prevotella sp.]
MMRLAKKLLVFIVFSLALNSCSNKKESSKWIITQNGYYFYGLDYGDNSSYTWKGDSRSKVIDGEGILKRFYDNNKVDSAICNASYGVINKKDIKETPIGKFIGHTKNSIPDGFGVLISQKGDTISIGNFDEGVLDGFCSIYHHNSLIYRGNMSKGLYNGTGMRIKEGEVTFGEWDNGLLSESFTSKAGKEFAKIWSRITNNNTDHPQKTNQYASYIQGQDLFIDSLTVQTNKYIEMCVEKTIEDRTGGFVIQPFRMFWQSIFTNAFDRKRGWMNAFVEHGLSTQYIEEFINAKIQLYNNLNSNTQLGKVKIEPFSMDKIITEEVYNNIIDREFAAWTENFWFECILSIVLTLIFVILFGAISEKISILLSIITYIICGGLFLYSFFFSGNIEQEITNEVVSNYINCISSQEILSQITKQIQ